ncbi:MAG: redoxin domain-containing protein [Bacteroidales bacterium]|nr:redoxin domain-containing protein [Bacteroidales bacterium]
MRQKKSAITIKVIIIFFLVITSTLLKSQNEYAIKLNFSGKSDSILILANYFGDKFQIVDTAGYMDNVMMFTGNTRLKGGIYLVLNSKKEKLFECLIDKDQTFSILSDSSYSATQIKTIDNIENDLFNKHLIFTNQTYEKVNLLHKQIEKQKNNQAVTDSLQLEITALSDKLIAYRQHEIAEHPGTYYAVLLKAMIEVKIPDDIKQKSDLAYAFMKKHYWDNFDLADSRLLRTPLLPGKIDTYIEKLTPPLSDSVIQSIDFMIKLTRENKETRDYLIWNFTSKYQNPKIMGLDKVFVYLADNYFAKFDIANTTPSIKQKIIEKSDQLRKILIGSKAPELWLIDSTGSYRSFSEIETDYTVIFFWDQECNICKKELADLKKLYDNKKHNLEVYAVCANADMDGWKNFIRSNQLSWLNVNGTKSMSVDFHDLYDIYATPVIYLLDKNKKIIAKRINANQISQVIQMQ